MSWDAFALKVDVAVFCDGVGDDGNETLINSSLVVAFGHLDGSCTGALLVGARGRFGVVAVGSATSTSIGWVAAYISGDVSDSCAI